MDQEKAFELVFKVVGDMAGSFAMAQAHIGDTLGLFKALAGEGPMTSTALAEKTGLNERYVREWGKGMVAAEYIDYDPAAEAFVMTAEQAAVLADEDSPAFVGGALQFTTPSKYPIPRLIECFKDGGGLAYDTLGEHIPCGIERFFRPGYINFLAQDWLPAIPGLKDKLEAGIRIGDVGCGCGQSSMAMAKAYPKSKVVGIDFDARSVERARKTAQENGLQNVEFVQGAAHEQLAGEKFDLLCAFDCIHDMVDPIGTLRAMREALSEGGQAFWIEPNASHEPLENRNPVGKAFANISPAHCMTVSLAHGGAGLGTILGEKGTRALAEEAGYSGCTRLPIEHPFNLFMVLDK